MKRSIFLILLIALTIGPALAQTSENIPTRHQVLTDEQIVENIDKYAEQVRLDWKIPGMAVTLKKDGKVLLMKGYGVKDSARLADKVDENTLFQIGSVSKSFTAAVVASLVDEGLLSWEDTVKNILPDFEMYDPWVSQHMQIKDLTSHRTGLQEQVGTYIPNMGYDRDDVYRMLKLLKPVYTFRGDYQYNNITFIPVAKIIEKVTGKSWEENVRERIFAPLGMTQSTLNGEGFKPALEAGTAALPYEFVRKDGQMVVRPLYGDEQALWWLTVVGPAGSVCCTPQDLLKWAEFHLNNGKVGDRQVISEKQMNYLHRGTTITSQNSGRTTLYGHCWYVEQTRKARIYFHTGTTWGMTTLCFFVPELNLCGTVQVNSEAPGEPRHAIARRAIDLFLGYEDYDYNAEYLKEWYEYAAQRAEKDAKALSERVEVPAPALDRIKGGYTKEEPFGDATVSIEGGKPYIVIGPKGWKRELRHVNGNIFNFRMDGWGFDITFLFEEGTAGSSMKSAYGFEIAWGEGEEKDLGIWKRKINH